MVKWNLMDFVNSNLKMNIWRWVDMYVFKIYINWYLLNILSNIYFVLLFLYLMSRFFMFRYLIFFIICVMMKFLCDVDCDIV